MRLLIDLHPAAPALGLAVDETILDSACNRGEETVRLWVNERSIILGRSQSISAEVYEDRAREFGIPVLRRLSGGGAVYHYPGNLNLTTAFAKRTGLSNVREVFAVLGEALAQALTGIVPDVHVEGNGIYIEDRKVGGAAQAHRSSSLLYHTTLMVEPPSIAMDRLLRAMGPDYQPGGVASRPCAVTSLSEHAGCAVRLDDVSRPIVDALGRVLNVSISAGDWLPQEAERAATLAAEKYGSDPWTRRH